MKDVKDEDEDDMECLNGLLQTFKEGEHDACRIGCQQLLQNDLDYTLKVRVWCLPPGL